MVHVRAHVHVLHYKYYKCTIHIVEGSCSFALWKFSLLFLWRHGGTFLCLLLCGFARNMGDDLICNFFIHIWIFCTLPTLGTFSRKITLFDCFKLKSFRVTYLLCTEELLCTAYLTLGFSTPKPEMVPFGFFLVLI